MYKTLDHLTHMCPLLKDPKVVNFLNQQNKDVKLTTSSVVIQEVPTSTAGVLTVAAIPISEPTPEVVTETTEWSAHEKLRDQMMHEVRQLQVEVEDDPT